MSQADELAKTVLQVVAIALGAFVLSVIAHKLQADVSLLLQKHPGGDFWIALARYFIRNLAGGASPDG